MISPGTEFMVAFTIYLKDWADSYHDTYKDGLTLILDTWQTPGEGEHKIISYINIANEMKQAKHTNSNRGRGASKSKGIKQADNYDAIVCDDRDIILLTLVIPNSNLYILMNIAHPEELADKVYIDISEMRVCIYELMNIKYNDGSQIRDTKLKDYLLIVSLCGNDFIPAIAEIDGNMKLYLSIALERYRDLSSKSNYFSLVGADYELNTKELCSLLQDIAKKVHIILQSRINKAILYNYPVSYILSESSISEDEVSLISPLVFNNQYHSHIDGTFDMPYMVEYDIDAQKERVKDWITSLVWILRYYTGGVSKINLNWSYKHHYAPTLSDIIQELTLESNIQYIIQSASITKTPKYVTPYEMLLAILPHNKLHLLPSELADAAMNKMPEMYPSAIRIDMELAQQQEHLGTILVPFINNKAIHTFYTKYKKPEYAAINRFVKPFIYQCA